jgi:hypothetical protein
VRFAETEGRKEQTHVSCHPRTYRSNPTIAILPSPSSLMPLHISTTSCDNPAVPVLSLWGKTAQLRADVRVDEGNSEGVLGERVKGAIARNPCGAWRRQ